MNIKEVALRYVQNGFTVIPLRWHEKTPLVPWAKIDHVDSDQVETWWTENPKANIGFVTGTRSGNICVVDIDNKHGHNGTEAINKWQREHGSFPETWKVSTPNGGTHLYFKVDTNVKNATDVLDGVDIRGNGGYVVAPPSELDNGRYQWEVTQNNAKIAKANKSVMDLLLMNSKPTNEPNKEESPQPSGVTETSNGKIPQGKRTDYLISKIGQLKTKNGISDEAIKNAIRTENQERLEVPLTEEELEKEVFPAINNFEPNNKEALKLSLPMGGKELEEIRGTLPPLEWLVDDILPLSGVAMIAGDPKTYKSFMSLDLLTSVAEGKPFMNKWKTHKTGVLYYDLESGKRRPLDRLKLVNGEHIPENFYLFTAEDDIPPLYDGFEEWLSYVLDNKKDIHFVVIDTLGYIRSATDCSYQVDVNDIRQLKNIAVKYNACILVVHHMNKKKHGVHSTDRISGTSGIFGTLDTAWTISLENGTNDAIFNVNGRDVEGLYNSSITFNKSTMKWEYIGSEEEVKRLDYVQEYHNDPIIKVIKYVIEHHASEDGTWQGTAQDLKDLSIEVTGVPTLGTNARVMPTVERFENLLDRDHIRVSCERTSKKRLITIYKEDTQHEEPT